MKIMKKTLNTFFSLLSRLVFKNTAYIPQEIDACITFYEAGDYKRAIEAGLLAVEKYPENPAAYYYLGLAYFAVGILKFAYENMKKAARLTNNKEDLMNIYDQLGLISKKMGYLDDALIYFGRSLRLARDLGNTDMQAVILNSIANICTDKGEFDRALRYYKEALRLTTNVEEKAIIYSDIANMYYKKGDYQEAIEYLQKAIEIDEKYGNYHDASINKLILGDTYREMKDYENAEKYLFEGLEGVEKVGDELGEATGYWFLGWLYEDKGDKKTAIKYYTRAYNLFKSIGAERDAQNVLDDINRLIPVRWRGFPDDEIPF
jgi:tetratricopeptide (TPR) repeat protein